MKKLLPLFVALGLIVSACGGSTEEKAEEQQQAEEQVDEKVNEIMNELEQSGEEAASDTAAGGEAMPAEGDGHEGHDHGDGEHAH